MNRVLNVLAAGAAVAVLGGCAATAEDGAAESLADYIGHSPLAGDHEQAVAAAESNKLTDEEEKQRRTIEDFVATCMRAEGFEYVPRYPDDEKTLAQYPIAIEASMSPEEFARQYGYGESTIQFTVPPDPNMKIHDGLSPDAQKAYDKAAWGDGGCRDKADKEVAGGANAEQEQLDKEFKDLAEDIGRLQLRLDDDPQVRDATKRWADCMADGGYPGLENTVDASNLVSERLSPIVSDENGNARPNPDQKQLNEVQDFEVAIATVDFSCQHKHIAPVREEVATRLEKQFVAEHKAELERFRDRAGDSGATLGGPA